VSRAVRKPDIQYDSIDVVRTGNTGASGCLPFSPVPIDFRSFRKAAMASVD
jgi:hypothetical protein